jgi:hypothetical protein
MNYEIQIFAKDRNKIIRFKEVEEADLSMKKMMAWEDFYYAMGMVIDDKADKFRENNTLVGRINVKNTSFDEVIDAMCEDLSPDLVELLTTEDELCVI